MHTVLLGVIFMLALAVTISVAVTVVGVLLIFALAVTPAAIAVRLVKRPLYAVLFSVGIALFATWAGIFIAFYEDEPTSFFIVTIVFVIYVIVRAAPAVAGLLAPTAPPVARTKPQPIAPYPHTDLGSPAPRGVPSAAQADSEPT
jgi:zinc/manganese transport system permease protein